MDEFTRIAVSVFEFLKSEPRLIAPIVIVALKIGRPHNLVRRAIYKDRGNSLECTDHMVWQKGAKDGQWQRQ